MSLPVRHFLLLAVVCFFCFWFRLGTIGFIDPDEPFYAQTAHEMVQSGDWLVAQIYGAPQFEKPIFYYWCVAAAFKFLGENEFTGRLTTGVFASALVLLVYLFGARVFNRRAGLLSALVMATGLEFMVMSRLMLTDIPLAFFVSASVFAAWLAMREPEKRDAWMFWHLATMSLAFLTKGPIGVIFPMLATLAFMAASKERWIYRGRGFWLGVVVALLISVPWYAYTFAHFAREFWDDFFIRDNVHRLFKAEHPANNHVWYYPGLLVLASIPWLPLACLSIKRAFTKGGLRENEPAFYLWCWLFTGLIFLSCAASKLPSYAFFLFVPLALIGGRHLDELLTRGFRNRTEQILVLSTSMLQAVLPLGAPFLKVAQPFVVPALALGGMLVVACVFLWLRRFALWAGALSLGSIALLVCALSFNLPYVDAMSSTKPVAERLKQIQKPGEPLLAGKFPIRGIIYYTGENVAVLSKQAQPFWAKHPLEVVSGKGALQDFVAKHGSALSVIRKSDWEAIYHDDPQFAKRDAYEKMGDNIIIRALPEEKKKKERPAADALPSP